MATGKVAEACYKYNARSNGHVFKTFLQEAVAA